MEKEKIQNLISQMTLEEKAGMCSGADFWHLKGVERLGIPSVIIDPDNKRRQLYGNAGCFRFTNFGCEYRVLSGYFISSYNLEKWVFSQTIEAINYLNNNGISEIQNEMKNIITAINNCDKSLALKLVEKFNINLKY